MGLNSFVLGQQSYVEWGVDMTGLSLNTFFVVCYLEKHRLTEWLVLMPMMGSSH
jgi:hypothetical protein